QSGAVVFLQIVGDCLCVGIVNRRAISLDHFRDLGIPKGSVGEGGIHRDVVEAVARLAMSLQLLKTRRFFQLNRLFVGIRGKRDQYGCSYEDKYPHGALPHASSAMLCITLLW